MILNSIIKLCEQKKVSIYRVEKDCDIGNGTIARWQNSMPSIVNLKKVADYFGVSIEDLLKEPEV